MLTMVKKDELLQLSCEDLLNNRVMISVLTISVAMMRLSDNTWNIIIL